MKEVVGGIRAIDGHAHIGLWDRIAGHLLTYEELRLLFPHAMLSSLLSHEEQLALRREPRLADRYAQELEGWAQARNSCHYEVVQEATYRQLYGGLGDGRDLALAVDAQRERPMLEVYTDCVERAGLDTVLVNIPRWPPEFESYPALRWIPYLDQFVFAGDNTRAKSQGSPFDVTIGLYEEALADTLRRAGQSLDEMDLDAFRDLADSVIAAWARDRIPAVKVNCAYVRSLEFEEVGREEATELWRRERVGQELSVSERKRLQDHLARFLITRAAKHELPIQIHAAVGDAPGLLWRNAHPTNLEPLFADPSLGRPVVVLLHGALPAFWLAGWYASVYARVYLDYSWLPFLSEIVLERCLEEWLDYVPNTKLLFGTDAWSPELFVAGTQVAREVLARVLERRVVAHSLTPRLAETVAERLMRQNAIELYRLA
jgi:predicted TIM-barrel fold metal-dependent hydrolase